MFDEIWFEKLDLKDTQRRKLLEGMRENVLQKFSQLFNLLYVNGFNANWVNIYVFYKTTAELGNEAEQNEIKKYVIEQLRAIDPCSLFTEKVIFEFDSDENVKRHYKGNYYFRIL